MSVERPEPSGRFSGLTHGVMDRVLPKSPLLNDRDERARFLEQTGIKVESPIPREIYDEACVFMANYVGREGDEEGEGLFLQPTIEGFLAIIAEASRESEDNRVIGTGRKNYKQGMTNKEMADAVEPFLVMAEKIGDRYSVGRGGVRRIMGQLKAGKIFCATPGATTKNRGILLMGRPEIARFVVDGKYHLIAAAMRTREDDDMVVEAIRMRKIDMPEIDLKRSGQIKMILYKMLAFLESHKDKRLIRPLYERVKVRQSDIKDGIHKMYGSLFHAITLYTMAEVAEMLPEGVQRGEIQDPNHWKTMAILILRGLRESGLAISGGFVDEE